MNYYSFHIGDYVLHTSHLTPLEDIAYRRLLDLYYTTEGPISLDVERVSKLIRMREHSDIVSGILSDFFLKSEAGYVSNRCEGEIAKYREKAGRAKSANAKRWAAKQESDLKSDLISDMKSCPNQEPRTNNQEPKEKNNTPVGFSALRALCSLGVDEKVAKDWIATRKVKLTQTAIDGFVREARKAGMSPNDAAAMCCQRGWRGFKAEWAKGVGGNGSKHSFGEKDYGTGITDL